MRLTRLEPALNPLPSRIAEAPPPSLDWKRSYTTRRWRKLRWSILVRDCFRCAICGHVEANSANLVVDHIEPHHGDVRRFWAGPFRTLCAPCHDALPHDRAFHVKHFRRMP